MGAFGTVHRGATGDARGSSQNDLAAEFLGDYVYAAATRTYGTGVWNDMRRGADCAAVDRYRQALHDEAVATGTQTAEAEEPRGESAGEAEAEDPSAPQPPDVQSVCPADVRQLATSTGAAGPTRRTPGAGGAPAAPPPGP